jgi:probable DNA metabolism protein
MKRSAPDTFLYDGSFAGYLSAVFEVFRSRVTSPVIVSAEAGPSLFSDHILVATDETHAERVASGIAGRTDESTVDRIYRAFLSEDPHREPILLQYITAIVRHGPMAAENVLFEPVLAVRKLARRTDREEHRMHAFVRFSEMSRGVFASTIAPDCDVLPLIGPHFQRRFPAMRWAIYDERRGYGIYYDLESVRWMDTTDADVQLSDAEPQFQALWRAYYRSVNVPERQNVRLHLQHVPKRYWRYLTEKS